MTSNNFRTLYKAKLKEDSTTASRTKSRGLERQQQRQDAVNKRRLLSDMSPVTEDVHDSPTEKTGTQAKGSNRLERLKQWREERKKKQEEEKKNSKKPMFKYSHLEYKDVNLFHKEVKQNEEKKNKPPTEPMTSTSNVVKLAATKPIAKPVTNQKAISKEIKTAQVESKKVVTTERTTRSAMKSTKPECKATKNVASEKTASEPLEKRTTRATKKAESNVNSHDLYSKPTAAALAKSTQEKHTNFLRAKPRQTVSSKSNAKPKAATEKVVTVEENTPERKNFRINPKLPSVASDSEPELHLSDSTVSNPKHSTPRPSRGSKSIESSGRKNKYRKTPAVKRNGLKIKSSDKRKSVKNLSPIEIEVNKRPANENQETPKISRKDDSSSDISSNQDMEEVSPERKYLSSINVSDKENILIDSPKSLRGAKKVTITSSSDEDSDSSTKVKNTDSAEIVTNKRTPIKRFSDVEVQNTPSTRGKRLSKGQINLSCGILRSAKRQRSTIISPSDDNHQVNNSAKRARFTNLKSPSEDQPEDITVFDAQEPDPDLPQDDDQNKRVTRKSVRLAELTAEENSYSDKKPATPKRRKSSRVSLRQSRSRSRRNNKSIVVSVSDEGTSGGAGSNIIEEIHHSPDHHKVDLLSLVKTGSSSRKHNKSELIDVSFEGTSLVSDNNSKVVYQVIKSKGSSRALQELTVAKIDGEISFIEVPLDESVSNTLPRLSSSSGDNTQSTQPFTPSCSNDVSHSSSTVPHSPKSKFSQETVVAPDEDNPTAVKSLRRRAYSIAPTFKTPVASAKSKKEKRRRKTDHVKIKSPEEMLSILSKSPMVEMSRRKSRFIPTKEIENEVTKDIVPQETVHTQPQEQEASDPAKMENEKMEKVNYYKNLVLEETRRLNDLCDKWTEYLAQSSGIKEDAAGQIRSSVGKAQLLINQRFNQFSGLINDCEFNLGEKETTPTDLQGFWDMIYFQVEDVDKLFADLEEFKKKGWQMKQPSPQNIPKKRAVVRTTKPKVKSNFAAFKQEMIKRKGKESTLNTSVDMATVDSEVNKVFDAGFFKVSSPIRSYSGKSKNTAASSSDKVTTPQEDVSLGAQKEEIKDTTNTPKSVVDKENKLLVTPVHKLLSVKRRSYLPTVPSPLLNDITGIKPKK